MRTYAKNYHFINRATAAQRANRTTNEWDIRVDISEQLSVETIISNIKDELPGIRYVFVSGIEEPDTHCSTEFNTRGETIKSWGTAGSVSKERHVHVALITEYPINRQRALRIVRGQRGTPDEYAAPRNPKFTYAGWIIHHGKAVSKECQDTLCLLEIGDLPMDPYTVESAASIKRLLAKWGTTDMFKRFKSYTDMASKEAIQAKIEHLQQQLDGME